MQEFGDATDAIEELRGKLPLRSMFGREGADFLARYPSILYSPEEEKFYRYFQRMVSVILTDKTGISTLRVRAFRPEDAQQIAQALLSLGEDLVNRINQRMRTDMVANGQSELQLAQARLIDAQTALTGFRNRELIVDPTRNAAALAG